jgi:hypothetical protein
MNEFYFINSTTATSQSGVMNLQPKIAEYIGLACPTCYRPIDKATGSDNPMFCQHDNSDWVFDVPEPVDVFEVKDLNSWTKALPGQVFPGE